MSASAALFEAARAAKLASPQAVRKPGAIHHGTQYAYQHRGCRCDVCLEHMRAIWRQRRAASGMKPQSPRQARPKAAPWKALECAGCLKPFQAPATSRRRFCGPKCAKVMPLIEAPEPVHKPTRHVHHWIIDSPNGPTSEGRCKSCGAEKDFINYDLADAPAPISWRSAKGQSGPVTS